MRALISKVLVIAFCAALPACDTLPERVQAPSASASASESRRLDDASIDALATAFMDSAEAYVARCVILTWGSGDRTDRCWPRGECPGSVVINIDKNCGYAPGQPEGVGKAARALMAVASKAALSPEARVLVRNVTLFDDFLRASVKPSAWCLENTRDLDRPGCWATTQGTVALYQDLVKSFNAWRPNMKRRVLPEALSGTFAGGVLFPFVHRLHPHREKEEARIAAEGLSWQHCSDGACLPPER